MKAELILTLLFPLFAILTAGNPDLTQFYAVKTIKELPANVKILSEKEEDGLRITALKFDGGTINGKPTRIYAYYTRPVKPGVYPAVLNIHGAGLRVLNPDKNYPKHGFVCLSIDWAGPAKQRKVPRKPPYSEFDANGNMADKRTGKWKISGVEKDGIRFGVIFARRALEFLRSKPEVDKKNIFTVGSSAGAHLSLLLIGLEPDIKAAVGQVRQRLYPRHQRLLWRLLRPLDAVSEKTTGQVAGIFRSQTRYQKLQNQSADYLRHQRYFLLDAACIQNLP